MEMLLLILVCIMIISFVYLAHIIATGFRKTIKLLNELVNITNANKNDVHCMTSYTLASKDKIFEIEHKLHMMNKHMKSNNKSSDTCDRKNNRKNSYPVSRTQDDKRNLKKGEV